MPVIAIGAAVGAAVFAGAGIAAAGITAVTAFEVIAAVGATVSAVGAVSRDKALTYAGGALGLVGGIGALASSAGVLGADAASGAPLFGGAAPAAATSDATDAAAINANTALAGPGTEGDTISSIAPADAGPMGVQAAAGSPGTAAAPTTEAAFPPPDSQVPFEGDVTNLGAQAAPQGQAPLNVSTNAAPQSTAAGTEAAIAQGTNPPPEQLTAGASNDAAYGGYNVTGLPQGGAGVPAPGTPAALAAAGAPSGGLSGAWNAVTNFVGKNQLLAFGAMTAGGQLLQSAFSSLTPAQVTALQAQAASNQAAANLTTLQTQNIGQPKPIATLAPVTGTPNPIVTPPTAGIMNSAPQVNVTGVPA